MKLSRWCVVVAGVVLISQAARAQVRFFFPGATAFTPEIGVVNSGALLDAQATVSADRKYVTLNMRPQNSALLALRAFNFQQGAALGNVGDPPAGPRANPAGGNASRDRDDPATAVRSSPSDILAHARAQASILHRPGMTRVSGLSD